MLRLCPSCRAEINSQSSFCFVCGQSLDAQPTERPAQKNLKFALGGKSFSPNGVNNIPMGTCIDNRWSVIAELECENGWATYRVDDLQKGGDRILQLSADSNPLNAALLKLPNSPYFIAQEALMINDWFAIMSKQPTAIQFENKKDWSFFAAAAAWLDALIGIYETGLADVSEANPWVLPNRLCFRSTTVKSLYSAEKEKQDLQRFGRRLTDSFPTISPIESLWLTQLNNGYFSRAEDAFKDLFALMPNASPSLGDNHYPYALKINGVLTPCSVVNGAFEKGLLFPTWDMLEGLPLFGADRIKLAMHGLMDAQTEIEKAAINCISSHQMWTEKSGEDVFVDATMFKLGLLHKQNLMGSHQQTASQRALSIRIKDIECLADGKDESLHERLDWVAHQHFQNQTNHKETLRTWIKECKRKDHLSDACVALWRLYGDVVTDFQQLTPLATLSEKLEFASQLFSRIGANQAILNTLSTCIPLNWIEAKTLSDWLANQSVKAIQIKAPLVLNTYEKNLKTKLLKYGYGPESVPGNQLDQTLIKAKKLEKDLAKIDADKPFFSRRIQEPTRPLSAQQLNQRKQQIERLQQKWFLAVIFSITALFALIVMYGKWA